MTKEQYIKVRANLDFKLRYAWLIGHVLGDVLLVALPFALLWNRELTWQWDWTTAGLSLLGASSLAIFYFRAFSMMHEAVHGLLATKRRYNDWGGLFYGAVCFLPFEQWREIHLLHHQWAGNIEKDPVRKLVLVFKQPPTPMRGFLSAMWRSWFPILALLQNYVFWYESLTRFWKKRSLASFLGLAVPLLAWGTVFVLAGPKLCAFVIVPSILLYLALVEVVNFPHHMDLPQYEGDVKLTLWEQYKIARSCFYPKAFERFVLLNFNYHTEHHLYPTLPWYRLEELSLRLRHELHGYNFSVGHAWIRRNRSKPLADVCLSTSEDDSSTRKAA
ncbi:MAG: fatty acid desaturase [Bdellovibrionales bacterium]|nr:fatty acid desaturase [Bdellovibrionales bacterium]